MDGFGGFTKKARMVRIPGQFFSDLLPQIDHLAELKVTLYIFWRLQRQENRLYVWEREIRADEAFMAGLALHGVEPNEALQEGLERATARGTLLSITTGSEVIYLVNTPRGRAAVEGAEAGTWRPADMPDTLLSLNVERPNIFTIYEQNIGPLTPMIAEQLRDFEQEYPTEWIEDAVRKAVHHNVRKISYIAAILKRRAEDGEPGARRGGDAPFSGKYADEIET